MFIKSEVGKDTLKFSWNKKLQWWDGENSTYVKCDVDISNTPKHIANFMFGILMSEFFSWNNVPVEFDELTMKEAECINNHVKINHICNVKGRVISDLPVEVKAQKIVEETPVTDKGVVLCCNGMGRDGLTIANLTKELEINMRCFTVGIPIIEYYSSDWSYKHREGREKRIWRERVSTMSKFYKHKSIPSNIILTNFMDGRASYQTLPYWIFGLPLAYHYGSNVVLMGLEISYSKTRVVDNVVFRPGVSIFSLDYITKATGVTFSSLTQPLSQYAVQKLLTERYPETLKYQRSCMHGDPWCNNCEKCIKDSLFLSVLDYDPNKIGLGTIKEQRLRLRSLVKRKYFMAIDTIIEAHKKLDGKSHREWIEQANENALALTWNNRNLKSILQEHFGFYNYDVPDKHGYICCPSKWRDWMNKGFVNICGRKK